MIRAGLALALAGWFLYQWGAVQVGGWTLVVGVALVALGMRVRRHLAYRRVRVHTHGGHGTRTAARHEDGHMRVGKALGMKTGRAIIRPDGSGVTEVWIPRDAPPEHDIAVSTAGRIASRDPDGCGGTFLPRRGSDNWHTNRAVARGGNRAEGEALARKCLSRTRSRADELYRKGEIR